MSWWFPTRYNTAGDVVDLDALNVNLRTFVDETGARLNEHNWHYGCLATQAIRTASIDAGAWCRLWIDETGTDYWAVNASTFTVTATGTWIEVESITVSTPGAILWVIASFSAHIWYTAGAPTPIASPLANGSYALAIDGGVIQESMVGSAEPDQDVSCMTAGAALFGEGSPGLWNRLGPVEAEVIIPVSAGTHVVSLMARANSPIDPVYIHNRSLYVIELLR